MKNTINNLPFEVKAILWAICKKRQSDFLQKNKNLTKKELELKRTLDYIRIDKLTDAIEKMNNWKLYDELGIDDLILNQEQPWNQLQN